MAIVFDPRKLIKKVAPKRKIQKIVSDNVTVKRTALKFLDQADFIDKKKVTDVALKAIKSYKQRIRLDDSIKSELLDDPKLLVQRVQNEIVFQVHERIKQTYKGQLAKWLPSDADEEPRPEHQLNYGKVYVIGEGIDGVEPGDEFGCRCGVEILTDDTELNLG